MGRPRAHGEQTRAELLAAAGRVLATDGLPAVTVRRVAEEAGTTTRAVYSLFGDKDGLVRALFRRVAEAMRLHHERVPRRDDDPLAEIPELAAAYRAAALEQPELYDLYLGFGAAALPLGPDEVALAYRSMDRVLDTLRRAAAAGQLPGQDPAEVGLQLWSLVHGLASLELRCLLGDPSEAQRRWQAAVGAALAGYRGAPVAPD